MKLLADLGISPELNRDLEAVTLGVQKLLATSAKVSELA